MATPSRQTVPIHPDRPAVAAGGARRLLAAPRRDFLFYTCAALFFVTLLLSIALVKYGVPGLPARAATAICIIGMCAVVSPTLLGRAIHDVRMIVAIIAACAALGILSSLLNRMPAADLARQLLEIHVQAAINVVVGACMMRVCGAKATFMVVAAVIGLSTILALFQFLGVDPAWTIRDTLQRMQPLQIDEDSVFLTMRLRAMGLSFSPVHLGTQLCLLFAAGFAVLATDRGRALFATVDTRLVLLALFLVFGCVVSGNRSPLIGIIVFVIAYLVIVRPAIALIITVIALPLVVFADDIMLMLADFGLRVARTDDGSSAGRAVLRAYGLLLFLDRPYGYGLAFDSVAYWPKYWPLLRNYENPLAITQHALHNYFLMVLNKYGALLIPLVAYAVLITRARTFVILGFIPYIVHIFFHNDGPLQGDFIIWFIMPMYCHVMSEYSRRQRRRGHVRSRSGNR